MADEEHAKSADKSVSGEEEEEEAGEEATSPVKQYKFGRPIKDMMESEKRRLGIRGRSKNTRNLDKDVHIDDTWMYEERERERKEHERQKKAAKDKPAPDTFDSIRLRPKGSAPTRDKFRSQAGRAANEAAVAANTATEGPSTSAAAAGVTIVGASEPVLNLVEEPAAAAVPAVAAKSAPVQTKAGRKVK